MDALYGQSFSNGVFLSVKPLLFSQRENNILHGFYNSGRLNRNLNVKTIFYCQSALSRP